MLVDLSRKPLIVYPEVCPSSVVVRSIGLDHGVNGIVSYWREEGTAHKRTRINLTPDAQITRGSSTLYETRLPLPGAAMPRSPYDLPQRRWARDTVQITSAPTRVLGWGPVQSEPEPEPEALLILPDPFEVASLYTDVLTQAKGTWRAAIRVEFVSKMKASPWVVSIVDAVSNAALSSVAVSGLDPNPKNKEPMPMTRAIQKTAHPANAWTRVLDTDDD